MSDTFQLQCPMPTFDFDAINLGHGSGGILSQRLLNSGVFDVLKNDMLNERHDGAVFELPGKLAFITDSYVVSPIFFPGGNIGDLAVNGTVNDLAMCGAKAKYLSLSFILEEGLPMTTFWQILSSIKMAFHQDVVENTTNLSPDELRSMIVESLNMLKGSVEELKETDSNARDDMTDLKLAHQSLEKEVVKYSIKLNLLENEINQLKAATEDLIKKLP